MDGGDPESLREMMGHEHVTTTLNAYVCFTRQDLQDQYDAHAPRIDTGLEGGDG